MFSCIYITIYDKRIDNIKNLTTNIADDIVKETSCRINRNVNIMNIKGKIIASNDISRIDSIHEGALKVINSGKELIIYSDNNTTWKGTEPGINLPIIFQNKILGVVGLTGDPRKMKDISQLVKMTAELMIKQQFLVEQMEWKQDSKELVIAELLKNDPSEEYIENLLKLLNLKITGPHFTIMIQINKSVTSSRKITGEIEKIFYEKNILIGFVNANQIIIITSGQLHKNVEGHVEKIHYLLTDLKINFTISYSLAFNNLKEFKDSYFDCDLALKLGRNKIISFSEIEVKALFSQINNSSSQRFSSRVLKNIDENKANTLESFFLNDLNIRRSADYLYIHRNTLIYRLKKIYELTGYNPQIFDDALTLQIALWTYKEEYKNY